MNPTERRHNNLVNLLYNNPKYLQLDPHKIIKRSKEVELYRDHEVYVKPDLIFETIQDIYYIEVKGVNSRLSRRKGNQQLQRMEECLLEYESKQGYVCLVLPRQNSKIINPTQLILFTTKTETFI